MSVFYPMDNSTGGPHIIDFMPETSGQWKYERGPHLAWGLDFGHVCLYYRSCLYDGQRLSPSYKQDLRGKVDFNSKIWSTYLQTGRIVSCYQSRLNSKLHFRPTFNGFLDLWSFILCDKV